MKALTVQQPWAWAIAAGHKTVENRTQLWKHRGPLAIHAGARISHRGVASPLIRAAARSDLEALGVDLEGRDVIPWDLIGLDADHRGAIIAVVTLVGAHRATDCATTDGTLCSEWAETEYPAHDPRYSGRIIRRDVVHYTLADPVPLEVPIHCAGRLGLWEPAAYVANQLEQAIG